jgi:hypothetical protein
VNHGDAEKRVDSDRETFPADGQAEALSVEPGKRPLNFEARITFLIGLAHGLLVFHTPSGFAPGYHADGVDGTESWRHIPSLSP